MEKLTTLSILFNKNIWDKESAGNWLVDHQLLPINFNKTLDYLIFDFDFTTNTSPVIVDNIGHGVGAVVKYVRGGGSSKMQNIMFDKSMWSQKEARKWLSKHGYAPIKAVHVTKNFLRYRLREPRKGAKYRIIKFGKGIESTIMY